MPPPVATDRVSCDQCLSCPFPGFPFVLLRLSAEGWSSQLKRGRFSHLVVFLTEERNLTSTLPNFPAQIALWPGEFRQSLIEISLILPLSSCKNHTSQQLDFIGATASHDGGQTPKLKKVFKVLKFSNSQKIQGQIYLLAAHGPPVFFRPPFIRLETSIDRIRQRFDVSFGSKQ